MTGTPLRIKNLGKPYATVEVQFRDDVREVNKKTTQGQFIQKRTGFRYQESELYLRDIMAVTLEQSLVLDVTYLDDEHGNLSDEDLEFPEDMFILDDDVIEFEEEDFPEDFFTQG